MGSAFRKSKQSKITQQDRAVLQLKQQRDRLRQYQKRIEQSLENDRQMAKVLIASNKKGLARLLLRKKRYQEQLLSNADKQLHQLEQLASDIEFAQVEVQVVEGLRAGNEALKTINNAMDLDEIAQMLEETRVAAERVEEVNQMLNGALTFEDEDAVREELELLIKEEMGEVPEIAASGDVEAEEVPEMKNGEEPIELPDVPKEKVTIKEPHVETRVLEAPLES